MAAYAEKGVLNITEAVSNLKKDVSKKLGIELSKEDIDKVLNIDVDGKKMEPMDANTAAKAPIVISLFMSAVNSRYSTPR